MLNLKEDQPYVVLPTSQPQTIAANPENNGPNITVARTTITLNCMVEVLPRTWPGINKPGGAARVTKCHYNRSGTTNATSAAATFQENQGRGERSHDSRMLVSEPTPVLTHVDVRYVVMGGRECNVPVEYCKRAPQYDVDNHISNASPLDGVSRSAVISGGQANTYRRTMVQHVLRDRLVSMHPWHAWIALSCSVWSCLSHDDYS